MDDLISRRLAIDTLAKEMPALTTPDGTGQFDHDIHVTDEAYVDCMQIINELPSAERWIPCNERMPEEKQSQYIVCENNGNVELAQWDNRLDDKYYRFRQYDLMCLCEWELDVIAWMPLPEPYKDGEQHG